MHLCSVFIFYCHEEHSFHKIFRVKVSPVVLFSTTLIKHFRLNFYYFYLVNLNEFRITSNENNRDSQIEYHFAASQAKRRINEKFR